VVFYLQNENLFTGLLQTYTADIIISLQQSSAECKTLWFGDRQFELDFLTWRYTFDSKQQIRKHLLHET